MNQINKKKLHILLIILTSIIFLFCLILLFIKIICPIMIFSFMQGDYTKNGIENYSPYNSMGLTKYFTLRDETNDELFSQYEYESISYRYHYLYKGELQSETVIAIVKYNNYNFNIIKEDITSSEYYSDYICTYKDYDFHLNNALPMTIYKFKYYDLNCDTPFVRFINCVGINNEENSFVFIGFYYNKINWISKENYGAYDFTTWDDFFVEFFPEI